MIKCKKYTNGKFSGPVLSAAFLTITVGIANALQKNDAIIHDQAKITELIKGLHEQSTFYTYTRAGIRAVDRFETLTSFGKEYFIGESKGL